VFGVISVLLCDDDDDDDDPQTFFAFSIYSRDRFITRKSSVHRPTSPMLARFFGNPLAAENKN